MNFLRAAVSLGIMGTVTVGVLAAQERPDGRFRELVHRLDAAQSFDRAPILREMQRRFPDSTRTWALASFGSLWWFERELAVAWIVREDGSGLPDLVRILPTVADSALRGLSGLVLRHTPALPAERIDSIVGAASQAEEPSARAFALQFAADVVVSRGPTPTSSSLFESGLDDPAAVVRAAAARGIALCLIADSSLTSWATPLLGRAARDGDVSVRLEVFGKFHWEGFRLTLPIDELRSVARNDLSKEVRAGAILALGNRPDAAQGLISDLTEHLQSREPTISQATLMAVERLLQRGILPTPALLAVLRSPVQHSPREWETMERLRALTLAADTIGLATRAADPDRAIARSALFALAQIAPAHPAIGAALDDPRPEIRSAAAAAIVPALLADSTAFVPATEVGREARALAMQVVEPLRQSGLVGRCFEVHRGPFDPRMEFGGDSMFSASPTTIALVGDPLGPPGRDGYSARVYPANGAAPTIHRLNQWRWDPGKRELTVTWSTGMSGVVLTAKPSGDGFRGRFRTFWDFPRTEQSAQATLTPVECRTIDRNGRVAFP